MTDSQLNCRNRAREFLFIAIYHNRTRMTRLFLKKFDIFFQSNSYELLRTSKEKREKQKKMVAITDWHGIGVGVPFV